MLGNNFHSLFPFLLCCSFSAGAVPLIFLHLLRVSLVSMRRQPGLHGARSLESMFFPSAYPIPGAEDCPAAFTSTSLLPPSQPPPFWQGRAAPSSSSLMLLVNCPKTGDRGVWLHVHEASLLFLVAWLHNLIFPGEIACG